MPNIFQAIKLIRSTSRISEFAKQRHTLSESDFMACTFPAFYYSFPGNEMFIMKLDNQITLYLGPTVLVGIFRVTSENGDVTKYFQDEHPLILIFIKLN